MHPHTSHQRQESRYAQVLRWTFLLTIIIFPFSNTLSLLLPAIGILACFLPTFYQHWRSVIIRPTFLATGLFILIVLLHTFNVPIDSHDMFKELKHYLLFIPIIFTGILFTQEKQKKQALNFLLISTSVFAFSQLIFIIITHFASHGSSLAISLENSGLIRKIIMNPYEHHLQDRGPFLAIGFLLAATPLLHSKKTDIHKPWAFYLLYGMLSLLFVFAVFSQFERVAYLCLFVAVIYLAFTRLKLKGLVIAATVFAVLLFSAFKWMPSNFAAGQTFKNRISELWQGPLHKNHNKSTQMRIDGLQHAWNNIKYKPLWGFGVGTFHTAQPTKDFIPAKHQNFSVETVYALIFLQLGLIGFISFSLLLFSYWRELRQLQHTQKIAGIGILLLLCTGGLTFPVFFGIMGISTLAAAIGPLIWNTKESNE